MRGAAPAGALIVRDAQYAPDEQTVTSPDGTWSIPIKLRVGVNDLIFRVGDDPRTELVLTLTFTPLASIATPTPPPTSTPDAEWITAACAGAATLQRLGDRLPELQVALGARDEPAATAVIEQIESARADPSRRHRDRRMAARDGLRTGALACGGVDPDRGPAGTRGARRS